MPTDLWALAADNLRQEDKNSLGELKANTTRVEDVASAVEERKKECKDRQWELKRSKGKDAIVLRDVFSKISAWLQKFVEVGDVAVNFDPGHAALPWAGIRFLLKQYAAVAEGVERMMNLIVRFCIVERLSRKASHEASKRLEMSLVELYTSIWRYLLKAFRYFGRSTAIRALRSVTTLFDKFREVDKAIKLNETTANEWFEIITAERSDNLEGSVAALTLEERESHRQLTALLDDLSRPIKRMEAELADVHDWLSAEAKTQILQWFSSLPYQQHRIQASSDVLAGTGDWLLRDEKLKAWGRTSSPSILWLRGPPGFGKTKLVSIVLRECLAETERNENPVPCYFYCTRNTAESERSKSEAILRSLVRQMASPGITTTGTVGSLPAPARRMYDTRKKDAFAAGPLTSSECVQLMIQLASQRTLTTIVIDALDECDLDSRAELLESLDQVVEESAGLTKILISSRNDRAITCHLEGFPNITINANDNHTDIARFVEHEVDTMIKSKRLLWGKVSTELRELIEDTLCERADGMFRWVSLSLQNFRGLTVERAVRNRLGKLPKDLQKLYQQTYDHQIETEDEDQISIAKDAFRLLLCLESTMSTKEFLTALSFCNEDEEILIKDDLLELCFNFVTEDQEYDSFQFTHLSVREFLESKEGFDRESCHRTAAIFCLRCVSAPSLAYRLFPNHATGMYRPTGKKLTSHEYASILWPYHLSLSNIHRLCEPLKSMAFSFMLGDDKDIVTFHEWSNVMYEERWRLDESDSQTKSLPIYGSRGQPINYEQMIRDSYRWTSKDSRPFSRYLTSEFSPKANPIFVSCVWDFSDILEARLEFDPTSVDLESDAPRLDYTALEKAWWTAAEPANRLRPLDLACLYENYDCAKILLKAGAKVVSHLALSFGIRAGRADIVELLLEHSAPLGRQSDIEMWNHQMEWPTGFGSNPLHHAVIVDSPTILDMLLRHGADPNIRIEGFSAWDLAKSKGKLELMRRLTDAGATSENVLPSPLDEHSVQNCNHVLFGNILQHLTREERLRLYFGLERTEDAESELRRQDVKAFLTNSAEAPLFTYSKDDKLLLVVTQHD
ncbi:MAG: hypothetical protein M1831_006954 [Alyxoria varia]|nr:MAG: hypothetical protein M1831_006954 [Alyxoria varia]